MTRHDPDYEAAMEARAEEAAEDWRYTSPRVAEFMADRAADRYERGMRGQA